MKMKNILYLFSIALACVSISACTTAEYENSHAAAPNNPLAELGDDKASESAADEMLGGEAGDNEIRQCVTLRVAAGLLWLRHPK